MRKIIKHTLLAVAGGIVATILSTIVCAYFVSLVEQRDLTPPFSHADPIHPEWRLLGRVISKPGVVQYWFMWERPPVVEHSRFQLGITAKLERIDSLPFWVHGEWVRLRTHGSDIQITLVDARGWPLPCFYSVSKEGYFDFILEHGIRIPGTTIEAYDSFAIPYLPIWDGVALNVLFYGVICFTLLTTLRFTRRRLRCMRGRCPDCAYRLPASHQQHSPGCPECGWNRSGPHAN